MQVTETKNEGLSREFTITVPAAEIEAKVTERLEELNRQVRIPGFRPGKVPVALLRKRYGAAVLGEVVERAVAESSSEAMAERKLQPATQPKIDITRFEDGEDLEFTISLEVMPEIEPADFRQLELERLQAKVEDAEVDRALERMAAEFTRTEPVKKKRKSKEGDVLVIDFVGRIDGEPFEGGSAKGYQLALGSGRFLPGFEDRLVGTSPGDKLTIDITFPEDYADDKLRGRKAEFEVEVKEIRERVETPIDDDFAKSLGVDSLDDLRRQMRERLEREYAGIARNRLKRDLLDKLDQMHDFEVPPGMVEEEFRSIWEQFEAARREGRLDEEDMGRSEEELREEYRRIAARRVRLGLLLSEVGRRNNIQVTAEELNRALLAEAQNFPGREREILEYYQKNERAMGSLRAPIFEEKVVDFILEMAKVTDREVSSEELLAGPAEEEEKKASAGKSTKRKTRKGKAAAAKEKAGDSPSKSSGAGKSAKGRKASKSASGAGEAEGKVSRES